MQKPRVPSGPWQRWAGWGGTEGQLQISGLRDGGSGGGVLRQYSQVKQSWLEGEDQEFGSEWAELEVWAAQGRRAAGGRRRNWKWRQEVGWERAVAAASFEAAAKSRG